MLTIFSTCRNSIKFPTYGILQYNAIKSWTLLNPKPHILILGNDLGTKELCEELNVEHLPKTKLSKEGVPVLPSMISLAEQKTKNDIMLLVSSDVILFQDTITASQKLFKKDNLLGVVLQKEKDIPNKLEFKEGWQNQVLAHTCWRSDFCGDYFMFKKGYWKNDMPPFVIGRARVDSWMFYYAFKNKNLVDMTKVVNALHQQHYKYETNGRFSGGLTNTQDFKDNDKYFEGKMGTVNSYNYYLDKNYNLTKRKFI